MNDPQVVHHVGLRTIAPANTRWLAPYLVIRLYQRDIGLHKASPPDGIIPLARKNTRRSQIRGRLVGLPEAFVARHRTQSRRQPEMLRRGQLFGEASQLIAASVAPQFVRRFRFDLAHPFARDLEAGSRFLEGATVPDSQKEGAAEPGPEFHGPPVTNFAKPGWKQLEANDSSSGARASPARVTRLEAIQDAPLARVILMANKKAATTNTATQRHCSVRCAMTWMRSVMMSGKTASR